MMRDELMARDISHLEKVASQVIDAEHQAIAKRLRILEEQMTAVNETMERIAVMLSNTANSAQEDNDLTTEEQMIRYRQLYEQQCERWNKLGETL